ncbi:MAG: hypothetical protein H7Y33_05415 [Cytophagales bacterium]|nr:hypothetical protein [Rhizobacter sp.]
MSDGMAITLWIIYAMSCAGWWAINILEARRLRATRRVCLQWAWLSPIWPLVPLLIAASKVTTIAAKAFREAWL